MHVNSCLIYTIYGYNLAILLYILYRSKWKSFTVAELNCNSLETICSWTIVLHGQGLLQRLFHWKSSRLATDWSMKTVKLSILNDLQCTVTTYVNSTVEESILSCLLVAAWLQGEILVYRSRCSFNFCTLNLWFPE